MKWLVKAPFIFFSTAASIGVLLRSHFIVSQDWLMFPFWLHAHSHIMFLGWVLNLLCIAYVAHHVDETARRKFIWLLWTIQFLLLGMLISFPLQGYGRVSIVLSAVHTAAMIVFIVLFFTQKELPIFNPALWFAKLSLIFFAIASLGPVSLGPIMANGTAHIKWYYFAIYYYLHFQYNGTFTFGAVSLLFFMLQQQNISFEEKYVKRFGIILFASVFPTYLLSTLWAKPPLTINIIGGLGMAFQIAALGMFVKLMRPACSIAWSTLLTSVRSLLLVSLSAVITKTLLQAASAVPFIAQLAYENRNYIIAYLHLVLLGMISSFLLAWAIQQRWIKDISRMNLILIGIGFVGMELMLVISIPAFYKQLLLFTFSVSLWLGTLFLPFRPITSQA